MKIEMLPADYGDCTLIELKTKNNDTFTVLVDGGTSKSYRDDLKGILENYLDNHKKIDLVIITHSDDDHIGGMNDILRNKKIVTKIDRVIYNSPYAIGKKINEWDEMDLEKTKRPKIIKKTKVPTGLNDNEIDKNDCMENINTGVVQATDLQQKLFDLEKLEMNLVVNDKKSDIDHNGIKIYFLSPTQELLNDFFHLYKKQKKDKENENNLTSANTGSKKSDYDIPFNELLENQKVEKLTSYNMASIAFLLYEEYSNEYILVMGDGSYNIVYKKIINLTDENGNLYSNDNPIKIDYFKLSHHGSICDLTDEFLKLINCKQFLISTSGKIFGHPDKKLIARVYKKFKDASFYFNYEDRMKKITQEGGIIREICKYERKFEKERDICKE